MRQAEVQSLFLQNFGTNYSQLKFRGLRRFPDRTHEPYDFALRVTFGRSGHELDLLCVTLAEGFPQEVRRAIERIQDAEPFASEVDVAPVVVVPYMAEEGQALCRGAGVGYFDLAGNAKLDTERIFLHIHGRPNEHARERQVTSPFEGRSERVV
ncbi:MAG: hypothetical protein JXA74_11910, partial [Anaerolineae bacterium]|nr:hypothetical protein [Anaerolineae bacterium]